MKICPKCTSVVDDDVTVCSCCGFLPPDLPHIDIPPSDPKEMAPEYLVDLALQKYACASSADCSKELHEWAMTLKAELLRRVRTAGLAAPKSTNSLAVCSATFERIIKLCEAYDNQDIEGQDPQSAMEAADLVIHQICEIAAVEHARLAHHSKPSRQELET